MKTETVEHQDDWGAFLPRAEAGDLEAARHLSFAYRNGLGGFEVDMDKALYWLKASGAPPADIEVMEYNCKQHRFGRPMTNPIELAARLEQERPFKAAMAAQTKGDTYRAIEMYERILTGPFATKAKAKIGGIYWNGEGVPVDKEKGLEYLDQAAADGNEPALHLLANAYESGDGVPQDYVKARGYYLQAKASGYHWAERGLKALPSATLIQADFTRTIKRLTPTSQNDASGVDVYWTDKEGWRWYDSYVSRQRARSLVGVPHWWIITAVVLIAAAETPVGIQNGQLMSATITGIFLGCVAFAIMFLIRWGKYQALREAHRMIKREKDYRLWDKVEAQRGRPLSSSVEDQQPHGIAVDDGTI